MSMMNGIGSQKGNPTSAKSPNKNYTDPASLQQALREKDQQISNLQGLISKLQVKNKEVTAYESAVLEYEDKLVRAEAELFKSNEKLRTKASQLDEAMRRLEKIDGKSSQSSKSRSYVSKADYDHLENELQKTKEAYQKIQHHEDTIQDLETKIKILNENCQRVSAQNREVHLIISKKDSELQYIKKQLEGERQMRENQTGISTDAIHLQDKHSILMAQEQAKKYKYQVDTYAKENQELKMKCHQLQYKLEQYKHSASEWSIEERNSQQLDIIKKYEEHIESMAAKLSSIHKVEMEKRAIDEDRRKWKQECNSLDQELTSLRSYCDSLQAKIRRIQVYEHQHLEADMQKFLQKNQKLTEQIQRLNKVLGDKHEQIRDLCTRFVDFQMTEQKFQELSGGLNNLEKTMNQLRAQLKKEQEKVFHKQDEYNKLQAEHKKAEITHLEVKSELAKLNRTISQKMQKIELQGMEIGRLKKQNEEKLELSEKLSKLQLSYKALENKFDKQLDESNQLAMTVIVLSAEIQRMSESGMVSKELLEQFDIMRIKTQETEIYIQNLEGRISKLEQLHHKVFEESKKFAEHLHASHRRWNHYQLAMKRMAEFLEKAMESSDKKYEEMDSHIEVWLKMQEQRVKDLAQTEHLIEEQERNRKRNKVM